MKLKTVVGSRKEHYRSFVSPPQVKGFTAADVGTYECFGKNDHGEASQQVIMVLAQYPEFIR